jgi:hypothetical protein
MGDVVAVRLLNLDFLAYAMLLTACAGCSCVSCCLRAQQAAVDGQGIDEQVGHESG